MILPFHGWHIDLNPILLLCHSDKPLAQIFRLTLDFFSMGYNAVCHLFLHILVVLLHLHIVAHLKGVQS